MIASIKDVRPLGERILCKVANALPEKVGLIYIPESAKKEKPQQGVVIAIGSGKYVDGVKMALSVKVGDTIAFGKLSGAPMTIDKQDYLLIKDSDILAVIGE